MKYLFSEAGLKLLESFCLAKTLFAFDFDGTLSEIVQSPDSAFMRKNTHALLKTLSERAPVAIISGRSLSDLRPRIGFRPEFMIGNHGLEGVGIRSESKNLAEKPCLRWLARLERSLKAKGLMREVSIENKTFSLAIHYRRARAKKRARTEILDAVADLTPSPRVILGKSVVNLVPAGAPHKGIAFTELMLQSGVSSAFYIGDDDTDEDVFTLPHPRILSVRVGNKLTSRAQFFIKRQSEINRLLAVLCSFHYHSSPRKDSWKYRSAQVQNNRSH